MHLNLGPSRWITAFCLRINLIPYPSRPFRIKFTSNLKLECLAEFITMLMIYNLCCNLWHINCKMIKLRREALDVCWWITQTAVRCIFSTYTPAFRWNLWKKQHCSTFWLFSSLLIIIPLLLHAHLSPLHEVCDSLMVGASFLTMNLDGLGVKAV